MAIHAFGLRREDFCAVIDGMEMDVEADIRAPDLATLDLYCDRVAGAVGRLSARAFGMPQAEGQGLAHHLGRGAPAHQHFARSRRGRGARPALPATRRSPRGGHRRGGAARGSRQSGAGPGLCSSHRPGKNAFRRGAGHHGKVSPRERARAEDHGGRLPGHSRRLGKARFRRAAPKESARPAIASSWRCCVMASFNE